MQVGCTACQCAKGLCRTMYAPILFHLPGKPGAQLRICHCRQILAELPTMTAEPGRVHGLESADAPGKMRSRLLRARVDCFRPGGLSQSVRVGRSWRNCQPFFVSPGKPGERRNKLRAIDICQVPTTANKGCCHLANTIKSVAK